MSERKGISKKLRFEVFKRDSFTCQYCGASAPDVILHVDHIKPLAEGGTDDIFNLITACSSCNLGKGKTELSDHSMLAKQKAALDDLNARREQMKLLLQWREELAAIEEEAVDSVQDVIFSEAGNYYIISDAGRKKAKSWIKKYGLDAILDAAEVSFRQYFDPDKYGAGKEGEDAIREAWEKAFTTIPRIAYWRRKDQDGGMGQLFYARGILRRRLRYVNEKMVIGLLKSAVEHGASTESLISFCKDVSSWTQFREGIESFIEEHGNEDGGYE